MIIVCFDDGGYKPVSSGYDVPYRIKVGREGRLQELIAEMTFLGGDGVEEDERRDLIRPHLQPVILCKRFRGVGRRIE